MSEQRFCVFSAALLHTGNAAHVDTAGDVQLMQMVRRCPLLLRRSASSLAAGRASSARSGTSRRRGCAAAAPRAAAATAEKAKAAKGPKPGSDKDKRITPKSTDFSR